MIGRSEIIAVVASILRHPHNEAATPEYIGQQVAERLLVAEAIEAYRRLLPSERKMIYGDD